MVLTTIVLWAKQHNIATNSIITLFNMLVQAVSNKSFVDTMKALTSNLRKFEGGQQ